ncbi:MULTISPECIES: FkbM family methyltransferase [Protofrankia]|uniref:FkbM family methyltransferase n=1 Tax=Protofrankia TaxID=2994361 RepID=UPI002407F8AA|nr:MULTISPECIES: FkbM family methyltransferase [Protofrankia]
MNVLAELAPDRMFAAAVAVAHRRFEPILRRVGTFVTPRQTALDVGAWYGPWSHWMSRHARRVVTVEPNPELAAFVTRTCRPNVTVVPKAASDVEGFAELWLPPGGRGTEGRACLLPQGCGHAERTGHTEHTVKVETVRLDSLDVDDVGLVKIDVEGHELAVLRGAEGIIRRWRPNLVVEIEDSRSPAAATLELLRSWHYRGWFLDRGRMRPLDDFDLVGHQREMAPLAHHGYLRAVLTGSGHRYVNTILFLPSSR